MRTSARVVVLGAAALVVGLALPGAALAAPAQPEPPLTPADKAAQYACLQENLDLGTLPRQAIENPVAFSADVANAAQICEPVRAPVS
ncbi:hypothetical protein [Pseudonocardia sp. HH130630-07]|uniref:hypothetical protein n=1 Tax=Pseudonocardia sp. HH130630-07 TaxID=1690815 RepID=UPI000814BB41|nr:hypothetical protein [Pseudonocardia sp. HH130630-07]ANY09287.1 hypothetical protein AFB00_26995 [Pseudonocardia sp. HH130630-07]